MADKGSGTSMSALGSFYDALYELAEKQQKVYGDAGVPDVVPYQVNDQIADGIVAVAASMTGSNTVEKIVTNQVTKPLLTATGQDVGFGITVTNPTIKGQVAGNQTFTNEGESYGFQLIEPGTIPVTPASTTSALLDPAGFANSLADAYWSNILLARQVDMISDFFGDPVEKVAVNYIADRKSGVDADIATTIAVANEGDVRNNTKGIVKTDLTVGTGAPGKVKSAFAAQAEEAWEAMNQSIAGSIPAGQPKPEEYDKYIADYIKDKAAQGKAVTKKDYDDFIAGYTANAEKSRSSGALDVAVAMNVGIDNQAERDEFIKFYNAKLKKDIANEYNLTVAGSTNNQIKNFNDIFDENNLGIKISDRDPLSLFDPAMGGKAVGDNVQRAYANALARHATDPTLSPTLRKNLQNFYDVSQNQHRFGALITGMSMGIDPKKNNIKYLVNTGVEALKTDWGGLDKKRDAKYARMESSLKKDFDSAPQSLARQAGYVYYRWNKMPSINKIFTPFGLMTGSSWLQMSTWAGGLTGPMAGKAIVAESLGIRALHSSGMDDKLNRMSKRVSKLEAEYKSKLGLFGSTDIRVKKSEADYLKYKGRFDAYAAKKKDFDVKTGMPAGSYGAVVKGGMGWKRVDVISHKANPFQKTAYFMYAFSPGAFFGGLLNGDTFQRLAWIGSGFGKNIKWKYVRNADGKGYTKTLDTSKFGIIGKLSYKMLNSKGYQTVARASRLAGFFFNAPAAYAAVFVAKMKQAAVDSAKRVAAALAKKLLGKTITAALAYITAGVSEFLRYAYMIGNFITFGALDKITGTLLRLTFQLVVGLTIGIIALTILGFQNLAEVGGPQYLAQNLGNGGLFAPDPNYSPVLAQNYGVGNYGPPVNVIPIDPDIDWEDYEKFSDNDCPLQVNGQPATYCSQGPKGTWSHAGNGGNHALDIAQSGIGVYAPVDGYAQNDAIGCRSTCETTLKNHYDYANRLAQCKGYVAKYGQNVLGFKWYGDDGSVYRFWHAFFDTSLSYGTKYKKGTLIGVVVPGASACSTGTHIHFEVMGNQNPDAAYIKMCKLSGLRCDNP